MSLKGITHNLHRQREGFTIVELLIVVVVIAILAAITIVSYNGITNRANGSAAASAAATLQKKAELFAADGPTGTYPRALADLTGAAQVVGTAITTTSSNSWYIPPGALRLGTPSASNGKTTLIYTVCGHAGSSTAPTTIAGITTITGVSIQYFNFDTGTGTKTVSIGDPTTSTGTNARGCIAAAS